MHKKAGVQKIYFCTLVFVYDFTAIISFLIRVRVHIFKRVITTLNNQSIDGDIFPLCYILQFFEKFLVNPESLVNIFRLFNLKHAAVYSFCLIIYVNDRLKTHAVSKMVLM